MTDVEQLKLSVIRWARCVHDSPERVNARSPERVSVRAFADPPIPLLTCKDVRLGDRRVDSVEVGARAIRPPSSCTDYAVTTFVTTVVTCHRGTSRSWPRPAPRGQTRSGRGGVGPSPSRPLPFSSGSCQNPTRMQVERHVLVQQGAADAGEAVVTVVTPTRDTAATSAVSTATARRRTEVRDMGYSFLSRGLDWASGPMLTDGSQFLHLRSVYVRKKFWCLTPSGGSRGPLGGQSAPFWGGVLSQAFLWPQHESAQARRGVV